MKFALLNIFLLLCVSSYSQAKVTPEDLKTVIGKWEGSITYLDYRTNKPFKMPANLVVTKGRNKNRLVLNNIYPNEPNANNSEKIKISRKGKRLNGKVVASREIENGIIQIRTEYKAKDDNKKALIRYTYIIGDDLFVIRKEVQFDEAREWIKRSEFNYNRKS